MTEFRQQSLPPSTKMTNKIGFQSLGFFLTSVLLFTCVYLTESYIGIVPKVWGTIFWGPALYFSVINIFLRFYVKGFLYDVSVRATFLGCAFATGLYLSSSEDGWKVFGMYICVMSFFHFSEFFSIAISNPESLSLDSFMLNHSPQYGIAAVSSWVEWAVEMYFFPGMKTWFTVSIIGLTLCLGGELMRKGAMFTAKTNFNHCVQFIKSRDHILVTHGLYAWCRHPSYVGWFYWSIGTQIVLLNPLCIIIYTMASWTFFRDRIYIEEVTLVSFFGETYQQYQKAVSTGLPFIHGYHMQ